MAEPAAPKTAEEELLRMTADVVAAYVSNNTFKPHNWPKSSTPFTNPLRSLEGQPAEITYKA